MITTPVGGIITSVKLINENQKLFEKGVCIYDVWLTRAIIFEVGDREISFEKDTVPFSEEITIQKGYNLIDKVTDNNDFLEDWEDGLTPRLTQEVIEVK